MAGSRYRDPVSPTQVDGARRLALSHAHPGLPLRLHTADLPDSRHHLEPRHQSRSQPNSFRSHRVRRVRPPFFGHSDKTPDGFGDFSFSGKFRILSANEKHGNYLLSTYVTATLPTGSYKNGATNATITPAITGGKGFGKFDAMVTIGSALPTGNTTTIGRTLTSNEVFQYHVQKYIWPELEINTTAWYGGSKDGKVQTFLTPGLMLGKYSFHAKDSTSRTGLAAGVAFQTAATTYHTYNHSLVYTGRFLF